jgi:hypothetical protein
MSGLFDGDDPSAFGRRRVRRLSPRCRRPVARRIGTNSCKMLNAVLARLDPEAAPRITQVKLPEFSSFLFRRSSIRRGNIRRSSLALCNRRIRRTDRVLHDEREQAAGNHRQNRFGVLVGGHDRFLVFRLRQQAGFQIGKKVRRRHAHSMPPPKRVEDARKRAGGTRTMSLDCDRIGGDRGAVRRWPTDCRPTPGGTHRTGCS